MSQALFSSAGALVPGVFRALIERSSQAQGVTDCEGRICYANPAFCRLIARAQADVQGALISSLLSGDQTVHSTLTDALRLQDWSGCVSGVRLNGERYTLQLSMSWVGEGEEEGCFLWQICAPALTRSPALPLWIHGFEPILDLVPAAAVVLDENENVLLANHEYHKLQDVLATSDPARLLLARLQSEEGEDQWRALFKRGDFLRRALMLEGANAEADRSFLLSGRWFDCSLSGSSASSCLLLVVTDCTELQQHRQAARLQTLQSQLIQDESVARLREALSGACFLFSQPLNMLTVLERRLALRLPEHDFALEMLRQVHQKGEEAISMLRTATPQPVDEAWDSVNCNTVLHDVLKMRTQRLLAEGVMVEWMPAMRVATVKAQVLALHTALGQLLDNAIDALCCVRGPRELRLASRDGGDWLELEICDNGPGIRPEQRPQVFEPFRGGHWAGRAGLGLVLAQDVIQRHQGILEIDPDYLAGCRMVVRLPVLSGEHHG